FLRSLRELFVRYSRSTGQPDSERDSNSHGSVLKHHQPAGPDSCHSLCSTEHQRSYRQSSLRAHIPHVPHQQPKPRPEYDMDSEDRFDRIPCNHAPLHHQGKLQWHSKRDLDDYYTVKPATKESI